MRRSSRPTQTVSPSIGSCFQSWTNEPNSPWPDSYESVWTTELSVRLGSEGISLDLREWVNQGLMTFFFLVIGLEAKRELDTGELRERQRVAIGRALLAEPRALLLDEPLTGLHAEARRQVLEYLRRMKRELGVFTLLVTHHADEVVALADEVVLLGAGEVTA